MSVSLQWIVAVTLVSCFASVSAQEVSCRIDLLILIDRSGSIKDAPGGIQNWIQTIVFVESIIEQFVTEDVESHVALVTFGNRYNIYLNLSPSKAELLNQIEELKKIIPNDNTNTSAGLWAANNEIFTGQGDANAGDRPGVPDVVILITDGIPTLGLNGKTRDTPTEIIVAEVLQLADAVKARDILLITIGVTSAIDADLLRAVATNPNNFLPVTEFSRLQAELTDLIQSTCVIIEAKTTPPPPKECRQDADIYFVLDSSGSVGETVFKRIRTFVTKVMQLLPIGQGVNVGIMYYSQTEFRGFNLKTHNSIGDAVEATNEIPYMGNSTNTAAIIRYLRQTGFTSNEGARSGVPSIAVVITDGSSNVNKRDTLTEVYEAKKTGIHFISLGIGTWIDEYELRGIASDPWEANYIPVANKQDFSNSDSLVRNVKALLCNDVNECDGVVCQCGGTCQDKIGDFICQCPGTCAGELCERDCNERSDVVFAVDSSSSLQAQHFRLELDFVRQVILGLNVRSNDQVGLLRFSTDTFIRFNLNDYSDVNGILNAITMHFNGGSTNTNLALQQVRNTMFTSGNGDNSNNANVLVILTDGRSTDFVATLRESRLVREAGITIISVGIGNSVRMPELQAMASGMGSTNVFTASSFDNLAAISTDVTNAVCNNRGECESMNCQNGGQAVDHIGYCTCDCPQGSNSNPSYSGRFCERRCSGKVDIVLIIDASGSIRNDRMKEVLKFITDVVEGYPVGDQLARFGAIYFSDNAAKAFDLNTYALQEDIITAIENVPFMGGKTNIADALKIAENDMFTSGNGDRSDAPNFVFLITDGKSNVKADETIPNAILVRENTAKIVCLGIGADADSLELRGMASYPTPQMMMMAPSFNDIINNNQMRSQLMNTAIMASCDDTNECDSNPCRRGTCRNDYHSHVCDCPINYGGQNCDRECSAQLDVALILDLSASLDMVYNTVIAFAREIIYGLNAPNNVRIAIIDFDDTARVHFLLNKYTSSKEFILNALAFSSTGQRTNTAAALRLLTDQVFRGNNGDRSGVKNVAVLVTDGGSNVNSGSTVPNANAARNAGIELFVAAFGQYSMGEINDIANDPDSTHTVVIGTSNDVKTAAGQMLNLLCQL